jgi:DNA-directed RNA polymerase specialized sigma24 family protein
VTHAPSDQHDRVAFHDAEDVTQEVLMRAWRYLAAETSHAINQRRAANIATAIKSVIEIARS